MQRVFSSLYMTLIKETNEVGSFYTVEVMSLYNMSGGRSQVEGHKAKSFGTEEKAREYANGWYAKLRTKGWTRTK